MKTTEPFYAVQLHCALNPRKARLAIGGSNSAGPHLFYFHKQAIAFKRALVAEGFKAARVVKVQATYRWS